jgi:uncharacterized protein (UPF0548 family)
VINEQDETHQRFGFAYGTLCHVENGEERFIVEWNKKTGEVYYDVFSFSVPQTFLTKMAYPVARYFQDCFAKDSLKALVYSVNYEDVV